jgi:hypothetical protein
LDQLGSIIELTDAIELISNGRIALRTKGNAEQGMILHVIKILIWECRIIRIIVYRECPKTAVWSRCTLTQFVWEMV